MRRTLFTDEHDAFRAAVRDFVATHATPNVAAWEAAGEVPRAFWRAAAAQGLIGFEVPEAHGGPGIDDYRFNAIVAEEVAYGDAVGDNFQAQSDIICPYLCDLATEEQQARWLPSFMTGDLTFAICMTEPGTGSDLRGIRTTARRAVGGYVLDGTKTWVTAGLQAGMVIVVADLEPDAAGAGGGLTLLCVEDGAPGFTRSGPLHKLGCHAQDTGELSFDEVFVPAANLLGAEGRGMAQLTRHLPRERLSIAVVAVAVAERALQLTVEYCRDRTTFGRPIGEHQGLRWQLADLHADVELGRVYVDRCLQALGDGELTGAQAATAKYWTTEMEFRVIDRCLQLHGGYGYSEEYPMARLLRNARVQRIYGGTSEIMRDIVGRSLMRGDAARTAGPVPS
ncbi:acyl-CoA dehydrogenase family protein [Patulibacter minatonensis]|uniref:acyl-CoA dehydrogenase family protein n=1 Tax=Patulibacter minatonensis TaxID=298163 RepID=UPI0004793851|nr:acyl-CoA dehydrogenase family protein [Patulibacter minatonensis]